MKKRLIRKITLFLTAILMSGMIGGSFIVEAGNVKISDVNYVVSYEESTDILLSNKKSIGSAVGTEVFLTYTVDEVVSSKTLQQGVVASGQATAPFPYVTGCMEYSDNQQLLQEGYTYFYKFKVTEDGVENTVIRAKGEESSYLSFVYTVGEKSEPLEYFGMWLGGGAVSAKLTKVRCYDKNGNDLGVQVSHTDTASCAKDVSYHKNVKLNHAYKVTVGNQVSVAISNLKKPTSDKVFMEYKVASTDTKLSQTGIVISKSPESVYPHANGGYLLHEYVADKKDGSLLLEGAEYIICMEKTDVELIATVQRTYKGEKKVFTFPLGAGEYKKDYNYFSIWLGEGVDYPVNCVLTDFKCYDSNNNNLGVQCNQNFTAEHSGEIEDYSGCEAVYFNHEDNSIIALYADKTMKHTKDGTTMKGTYYINDSEDKTIIISYKDGKEIFSYMYKEFVNEDGDKYKRLGTYYVIFKTGTKETIETQTLSAENGYVIMKPNEPTKDGEQFEGWYTADGERADFDSVTTKSVTLYAKWAGDVTRTQIDSGDDAKNYSPYIAIGSSLLILAVAIAGGVYFIRSGGKKHGKN